MDDEFALCWNNFQENIASGFQNLFDRGDLVDVTLACDGKLLQAHKIVLAICSPYFQEMFITNPCRHPIIILKDVPCTVMTELLQFMYQGVVNVKHTELNSFMKIAQQLQIKGLHTSSKQEVHQSQSHHHAQKSPSSPVGSYSSKSAIDNYSNAFHSSSLIGQKRAALDYSSGHSESATSKKHLKRSSDSVDNDISAESMENLSSEDGFPIPQISMIESGRFDLSNVKRESGESPSSNRNLAAPYNFEYSRLANAGSSTGAGSSSSSAINANHMDIPTVTPGEKWCHGKLEFMLSQRGKPLLVHDGHSFGIQYIRKDKKYWQCNLSRKFNCKARVTTTDTGEIIVTNNEHCHTEIRQHLKKEYKNKLMLNALSHFNHHLHSSALSGNGPTESGNINNNNNNNSSNNNNNNNENARARSSSPQISSNGSWNLKKESN
ncbi:protein abrupt-like isoform X3 [Sitodiplosis mosellana]|uniref:protein abrupt-like isoform X3 n=1 Tax=Sitodiplosis mosellana TaxID=263140 RepID=UPI00244393AF|nr:protein abrupt-like isoform X3 [Sitodiplosis mosellana]